MTPISRRLVPRVVRKIKARVKERQTPSPRWGNTRRLEPFSNVYGLDRGTAIDRVYIEAFLDRCSQAITGYGLEIGSDTYLRRFGGSRLSRVDVLDVDPLNKLASVVADLCDADCLPEGRYDCVIFTQTLQFLRDPCMALENLSRALRAGGTLLISVPVVSRIDPTAGLENDYWRFTAAGLGQLLNRSFPGSAIAIGSNGNLLACTAFLLGIEAEELSKKELLDNDHRFPLIATAQVTKSER